MRALWLVGSGIALSAALLTGAELLADGGASGHAQLHAAIALAALVLAGAILWVRRGGGAGSRALVIALVLVAAAQLLEAIGALGYAADNDTRRSDLALAHDAGIMATPVALLGLAITGGIAAAARIAPGSRRAGVARSVAALGVTAAGVVLVALLSGVL